MTCSDFVLSQAPQAKTYAPGCAMDDSTSFKGTIRILTTGPTNGKIPASKKIPNVGPKWMVFEI